MKKNILPLLALSAIALTGCSLPNPPASAPVGPSEPPSSVDMSSIDVGEEIGDELTDIFASNGVALTADIDDLDVSIATIDGYLSSNASYSFDGRIEGKFNGLNKTDCSDYEAELHIKNSTYGVAVSNTYGDETYSQSAQGENLAANFYIKSDNLYFDLNENLVDLLKETSGDFPYTHNDKFIFEGLLSNSYLDIPVSTYIISVLSSVNLSDETVYINYIEDVYATGTMLNFVFDFDETSLANLIADYTVYLGNMSEEYKDAYAQYFSQTLGDLDLELVFGIDAVKNQLFFDIDLSCSNTVVEGTSYQEQEVEFDGVLLFAFGNQTINFPDLTQYTATF